MDLTPQKIEDLIQKEIEGTLTQAEADQLEQIIHSNPEVRQQLSEALWVHGNLSAESNELPSIFESSSTSNPNPGNTNLIYIISALAAAVALVWLGSFIQVRTTPQPVATLIRADNCTWGASDLPTKSNSPLPPGQLQLLSGIAEIQFVNGAMLTMEAPSNVELISQMDIKLIDGSVVLDIPEQAHGFTVETREGKVVDFGTRFGVTQTEFSNPQIWVFEGEVELRKNESNQPGKKVFGGQHASMGKAPEIITEEIDHGQLEHSRDGWITKIPFKDNYIRHGHKSIPNDSPLLMVKYSTLATKNCRLSYLSFDLGDIPLFSLQQSELTLELQPSGKGFASEIPDCNFTLYGVLSDDHDAWEENTINPKNAPAYNDKTRRLIQNQVIPLGTFQVDRGVALGTRRIKTKDLSNYIKQDKNKIITLIIERDNDELGKQGLVNAFASRENPNAAPPRLHLKFKE